MFVMSLFFCMVKGKKREKKRVSGRKGWRDQRVEQDDKERRALNRAHAYSICDHDMQYVCEERELMASGAEINRNGCFFVLLIKLACIGISLWWVRYEKKCLCSCIVNCYPLFDNISIYTTVFCLNFKWTHPLASRSGPLVCLATLINPNKNNDNNK